MRLYLKILGVFYFIGGILHILDVFHLRLKFGELPLYWKYWIIYLLVFDLMAAIGLWYQRRWGQFLFLLISGSQLIAYIGFANFFGNQYPLIAFHIVTLAAYLLIQLRERSSKK